MFIVRSQLQSAETFAYFSKLLSPPAAVPRMVGAVAAVAESAQIAHSIRAAVSQRQLVMHQRRRGDLPITLTKFTQRVTCQVG
jgi:hypothetical protein